MRSPSVLTMSGSSTPRTWTLVPEWVDLATGLGSRIFGGRHGGDTAGSGEDRTAEGVAQPVRTDQIDPVGDHVVEERPAGVEGDEGVGGDTGPGQSLIG